MLPVEDQEMTPSRRMIVEQRVGSFLLPFELVEGRPSDVMALLATTLIVRCEMRGDFQAYEYSAYCAVFDPLAKHGWPPRYEVRVAPDNISFVPRVPPGMALVGEAKRQQADPPLDWRAPVDDRNGGRG